MKFKLFPIFLLILCIFTCGCINGEQPQQTSNELEDVSIYEDSEDIILTKNMINIETDIKRLISDIEIYTNLVNDLIENVDSNTRKSLIILQKDFKSLMVDNVIMIENDFSDLNKHLSTIDVSEECRVAMESTLNKFSDDIKTTKYHLDINVTELPLKFQIFNRDINMMLDDVNMLKRELNLDNYAHFEIIESLGDYW